MGELAEARTELELLEEQERQLLERLRNVRTAIQVQRNRIDRLLKHTTQPPISRLPVTALYQIIYLASNDSDDDYPAYAHPHIKWVLARVSRLWRDVILTFPGLWTTVAIDPSWSASLVLTHMKRSRECPLNIQIQSWADGNHFPKFCELLGLVISCGYRWRSLTIEGNLEDMDSRIIRSIWNVSFPSLKHVAVHVSQESGYPPFLDPQHAHTLEYLDLGESITLDNFSAAASLKSLRLQCSPLDAPLLPSITSLRTLTVLSISGSSCGALPPDSIHLPLLESLTAALDDPRSFVAAIVTPRLSYFSCSSSLVFSWSEIFTDLEDKFVNVQHLCLRYPVNGFTDFLDAVAVYAAFPGVRHIEMNASEFDAFCWAADSALSAADRWTHLEHLSLERLNCSIPNDLVEWLHTRKLAGRPALQVTLSKFNTEGIPNGPWLISLYNSLHEYCLLELKDVLLTFNLTVRSSDSDVYGNPPIMGMLEWAMGTELACASTETD